MQTSYEITQFISEREMLAITTDKKRDHTIRLKAKIQRPGQKPKNANISVSLSGMICVFSTKIPVWVVKKSAHKSGYVREISVRFHGRCLTPKVFGSESNFRIEVEFAFSQRKGTLKVDSLAESA